MTLSVVLPNYNHAHLIEGALDAILTQDRRPDEVLVIDDGSTDNSLDVLQRIAAADPIVRVLPNDRNRGANYSLNRGLRLAEGRYVYLGASDDRVRPGLFAKSLAILSDHPEAGLCCSDPAFLIEKSGLTHEEHFQLGETARYFSPEEFRALLRSRRELSLFTSSVVARREAAVEAGGLLPELRWHSDWFMAYVLALRHGLCYVPEPLAVFRIEDSTYSTGGMGRWGPQSAVVRTALQLVSSEAFADVRDAFRIPAVLSRFGLKVLCEAGVRPRCWQYLSWRLAAYAVAYDWRYFDLRRRIYWSVPRPVRDLYQWTKGRRSRQAPEGPTGD